MKERTAACRYRIIFGAVESLTLATLEFHTAHSALAGLWIVLAALPGASGLGSIDWYKHSAGTPLLYGLCATVTVLPGALLNAAIAYAIAWDTGRAAKPAQK